MDRYVVIHDQDSVSSLSNVHFASSVHFALKANLKYIFMESDCNISLKECAGDIIAPLRQLFRDPPPCDILSRRQRWAPVRGTRRPTWRAYSCVPCAIPGDVASELAYGRMATPQGRSPTGIFLTTIWVSTSTTETSCEGPFAV